MLHRRVDRLRRGRRLLRRPVDEVSDPSDDEDLALSRLRPAPPPELVDPEVYYRRGSIEKGRLLFIPGSASERSLRSLKSRLGFQRRFQRLKKVVRDYFDAREEHRRNDPIYYVLDSASGISRLSLPTLQLADLVLVFFRWSIQHYHGTRENIPVLKVHLEDACDSGMKLALVGNCTPTVSFA